MYLQAVDEALRVGDAGEAPPGPGTSCSVGDGYAIMITTTTTTTTTTTIIIMASCHRRHHHHHRHPPHPIFTTNGHHIPRSLGRKPMQPMPLLALFQADAANPSSCPQQSRPSTKRRRRRRPSISTSTHRHPPYPTHPHPLCRSAAGAAAYPHPLCRRPRGGRPRGGRPVPP